MTALLNIIVISLIGLLLVIMFNNKIKNFKAVIQSLNKVIDELSHSVLYDKLTGLPSMNLFTDRINHVFAQTKRSNEPHYATLLYIDVNNFKQINDQYGHNEGDKVLQIVAKKLTASVRPGDTVARLHGDEFAIILNNKHSTAVIKRLTNQFPAGGIEIGHNKWARVGISIGAVRLYQSIGSVSELIRLADVAMYAAKLQCKDSGLMSGHKWSGVNCNVTNQRKIENVKT